MQKSLTKVNKADSAGFPYKKKWQMLQNDKLHNILNFAADN